MKLSDLKTGQRGVIVKVTGHGGFRKRIVEMGFIKGKVVDVLQNAPLQDPVKYKIMGYEVSLRHSEAEMIEVVSEEEAAKMESQNETAEPIPASYHYLSDTQLRNAAMKKRRTINVALIGNPNCGKTSLFNFASDSAAISVSRVSIPFTLTCPERLPWKKWGISPSWRPECIE